MRYISIFTNEGKQAHPPSPEMMAKMGALIEKGMKEGWLIQTEGVSFSDKPIKVSSKKGKITVTDGPFAEAKEVLGGYALMEARDREHVLQLTRDFLAVAGDGTCEIHELYEMPK
ncbi:MAG TPA: YciI family protein [Polyangia bacterium]|nr:YciI family protein [Polyangia bacterium]